MSEAAALLTEIIDHFANTNETPGDFWAHCDSCTSYGLDHQSSDGTKFWIDLDKDGTITILWKPAGRKQPEIKVFTALYHRRIHEQSAEIERLRAENVELRARAQEYYDAWVKTRAALADKEG